MCLVLPMTMLLVGCQVESSDVVVKVVCPAIQQYPKELQDRALAEYAALPKGSAIKEMIGDYLQLRDRVRACRGEVPTGKAAPK